MLRVLLGPRLDHRVDLVDELHAVAAVGVARVVGQLGPAEDGDERLPHLGGRAVDEHVIVRAAGAAAIDVGRRGRRRAVALARRRLAGGVALAQVDAEQVHHRFLLGDLDLLAHARRVALDDRGEDADGRVQAGAGVGETADGLRRRAVGRARHAHRARHRLRDPLEGLVLGVGPGAAEALHGGGDEARVELLQRLVAEAEALHRAGAHVLDDDVRRLDEGLEHRAPARRLQIERHALLVGVQQQEEPRVLAALVGERGAAGLASGRFDLDDVGAQPRQHLGAGRAGFVLGQVEDANAVEGLGHGGVSRGRECNRFVHHELRSAADYGSRSATRIETPGARSGRTAAGGRNVSTLR